MGRVVVTGATGTIGTSVCSALLARGDEPVALSRDADRARASLPAGVQAFSWATPESSLPPVEALAGAAAVINLMGEPIAQRWNGEAKQRIRHSRVAATAMLTSGLAALEVGERPPVLISQSATGYYGPRGDEPLDEQSASGSDFLAGVVKAWEASALGVGDVVRVAVTRTGVVLSPAGGALAKMLPFFKAGVGGPVAGGRQYVPWIHVDDVVSALLFCLDEPRAVGPVNLAAPNPVTNATFSRALGRALHRPAVLPVPGFALNLLYGEMAEIVTSGQRVVPERLSGFGFQFQYPQVDAALKDVL